MPLSISPFVCFLPPASSASRDSLCCCVGLQVGKGRLYTPIQDDIGSILKCEVVSIDAAVPFSEHGKTFSMSTQRVRPTPSPPKRALAPVNPAPWNVQSTGRFTALTYNLLADLYATVSRTCLGCECNMQHAGCVLCASGTCTPCECISGKRTLHSRCIYVCTYSGEIGCAGGAIQLLSALDAGMGLP